MASLQPVSTAGTHTDERRRYVRRNVLRPRLIPVDVDGNVASAFLVDISENGFALQILTPLKGSAGRTLSVVFKPKADVSVTASVTVAWSSNGRTGLRITRMDEGSRAALNGWLSEFATPRAAGNSENVKGRPPVLLQRPMPAQDDLYSTVARARVLTCANGSAIAWTEADGMVCRASTGEAPPVGVPVQMQQGLSGECIRTGEVVRCDDTEADSRVDPEVCRQLKLRSVVIVPVKVDDGLLGLLEVFSSKPHAFTDQDVAALLMLAGDCARSKPAGAPGGDIAAPMGFTSVSEPKSGRSLNRLKMIAPLAFGAALLLGGGIRLANKTSSTGAADRQTQIAPGSVQEDAANAALSAGARDEASESPPRRRSGSHSARHAQGVAQSEQASATDNDSTVGEQQPASTPIPSSTTDATDVPAPALTELASGSDAGISPLAGSPVNSAVPVLIPGATISRISPARLIRKVEPMYPPSARWAHKEGTVELRITVAANGRVKNIRQIEGDPELATAATDAVRQWRYEPYRMDGRPVAVDTQVTVAFKLVPREASK